MRILITRTDRIGDVAISTPVIKAVRDAYPDSFISFCVEPHAYEIVKDNSLLNEVIISDKRSEHRGMIGALKFISLIAGKKFDAALILHPTNRMHMACFLAGIPVRVGWDRKLGFLLTKKVPHVKQEGIKHEAEYTLDILRAFGITPKDAKMSMTLPGDTDGKVKEYLVKKGVNPGKGIVAVHAGASCRSKIWPAQYFAELIDLIRKKYDVNIILVGGKDSIEHSNKVKAHVKSGVVDVTGDTGIQTLAGILRKAKVFISNDSGPVHIAVCVGAPVIAIFGRKDPGLSPKRWGPRGARDIVFHADAGCVKCLAHNCALGFKCLTATKPEKVFEAVKSFL